MSAKESGRSSHFAFDPAGSSANSISGSLYNVTGIPTQHLISPAGKTAWSELGYTPSHKQLAQQLQMLGITTALVATGAPNQQA